VGQSDAEVHRPRAGDNRLSCRNWRHIRLLRNDVVKNASLEVKRHVNGFEQDD
jgi:hypothetical protein